MSDWLGIGFFVLLIIGAIAGIAALGKPYKVTEEEYEKRVDEGPGLIGAGMIGIQKMLDPGAERAAAVIEDFKAGHLDKKQESGDDDDKQEDAEREGIKRL